MTLKERLTEIALCLLGRLVKDDAEKTAAVGTLEAERDAANQAPTSRAQTVKVLEEGRG